MQSQFLRSSCLYQPRPGLFPSWSGTIPSHHMQTKQTTCGLHEISTQKQGTWMSQTGPEGFVIKSALGYSPLYMEDSSSTLALLRIVWIWLFYLVNNSAYLCKAKVATWVSCFLNNQFSFNCETASSIWVLIVRHPRGYQKAVPTWWVYRVSKKQHWCTLVHHELSGEFLCFEDWILKFVFICSFV